MKLLSRLINNMVFPQLHSSLMFACEELKRKIAQERRAKWRQEAHKEYAKSDPKYMWESVDGEDFLRN